MPRGRVPCIISLYMGRDHYWQLARLSTCDLILATKSRQAEGAHLREKRSLEHRRYNICLLRINKVFENIVRAASIEVSDRTRCASSMGRPDEEKMRTCWYWTPDDNTLLIDRSMTILTTSTWQQINSVALLVAKDIMLLGPRS